MECHWTPDEMPAHCDVNELEHFHGDPNLLDDESLPIQMYADTIRSAINANSVVGIQAQTGSGKTLLVPGYLHQEVQSWPVLIVQKSCLAAEMVWKSLQEYGCYHDWQLHLRTGLHHGEHFQQRHTLFSVITYGILWEWFSSKLHRSREFRIGCSFDVYISL